MVLKLRYFYLIKSEFILNKRDELYLEIKKKIYK